MGDCCTYSVVCNKRIYFAKNHMKILSAVGDCCFSFYCWWLLLSCVSHQIHAGDCSFSGKELLHLYKNQVWKKSFFFQRIKLFFYFWLFCTSLGLAIKSTSWRFRKCSCFCIHLNFNIQKSIFRAATIRPDALYMLSH